LKASPLSTTELVPKTGLHPEEHLKWEKAPSQ